MTLDSLPPPPPPLTSACPPVCQGCGFGYRYTRLPHLLKTKPEDANLPSLQSTCCQCFLCQPVWVLCQCEPVCCCCVHAVCPPACFSCCLFRSRSFRSVTPVCCRFIFTALRVNLCVWIYACVYMSMCGAPLPWKIRVCEVVDISANCRVKEKCYFRILFRSERRLQMFWGCWQSVV